MLYKKQPFTIEKFISPSKEYRGTPFWGWNCMMNKESIDFTLDALQQMGMGGAHIHCRTGMANQYLGSEFMELVKYTNEESKKRNMLTWLYDEDRWPSGAAGGYVTKDYQYRCRFLVFSPEDLTGKDYMGIHEPEGVAACLQTSRSNNRQLLNRYGIVLEDKVLKSYRVLDGNSELYENEVEWYAYLEVSGDSPWYNNQAYLNTLDKKSVERFIEVTHEKYYDMVGDEFGKSIPAIFTDEPKFTQMTRLRNALDKMEIIMPYTDDLEQTYRTVYGESLLEKLPEIFWELPNDKVSKTRYAYHDHIAERFASAYADTIGSWCEHHNILLTGHLMEEPTLYSQTSALGDAMRSYRSFHIPGIDMLCDWRELSTAKQAQSAVHQYGRDGVMSELYGVTNWDFDFRGHKLQGDWQAALGVTVRVPHLTWTSMKGEAKRDFPASIGYQSPWYKEYSYIEDYYGRINTVLSRGKAKVKIGVIHPIESYWLYWGPDEQTSGIRKEMDGQFNDLINWLLYGFLDFDFISESLLPELYEGIIEDEAVKIGEMSYDVVLVPNCRTLRKTTITMLEKFHEEGGRIIFAGKTPDLIDAEQSTRAISLAEKSSRIIFSEQEILSSLSEYRIMDIQDINGNRATNMIAQIREEEEKLWVFVAHVEKMRNADIPIKEQVRISFNGIWNVEKYDTLTGEISQCYCEYLDDRICLEMEMYNHDSLLLCLTKGQQKTIPQKSEEKKLYENVKVKDIVPITLEEPNVLVLDIADYKFDNGIWNKREELLRIDNKFREILEYPLRMEALAQPWVECKNPEGNHKLTLRFDIVSHISLDKISLGIEEIEHVSIKWNGEEIQPIIKGWYVDRAIKKIQLTNLICGNNELIIEMPFYEKCNVECMYLLGDFGVNVIGQKAVITEAVTELAFSDITRQGLPFYGGNIIYHLDVETEECELLMQVTKFRNPVLKVAVEDVPTGYIAFAPYEINIGRLQKGKHRVDLIAYGNRVNTFGTLHNADEKNEWYGLNSWRTTGSSWCYEYQLKASGILKSPNLLSCRFIGGEI